MISSFFKPFLCFIFSILFISILFCLFIPIIYPNGNYTILRNFSNSILISAGPFLWPTPGYTIITSPFGSRQAPTSGASTFHSGIDIGAPTGTNIVAVYSGMVTFLGFNGAGGFTIIIEGDDYSFSYCHVDPNYIIYVGQYVKKGQLIGKVGPEYVYSVPDNPYTDENGNPTNGATTGPHLHLTIRKNGELIDPLKLIDIDDYS